MTNFIPIFPLNIVVFPSEKLHLHIFEPRYKQLIKDCFTNKKPFGIPIVLGNELREFGCVVEIKEITKEYSDGKMDIKTEGIKIFRLLELITEIPEKLYGGAIVNYPENVLTPFKLNTLHVVNLTKQLHNALQVSKDFKKTDELLCCYDLAHHIGLTIDDEFEFIQLLTEDQRIEFIKRHLQKMLFEIDKQNNLKQKRATKYAIYIIHCIN